MARAWLDWLAHQRRQSPATVKAYRTDLYGFVRFCAEHQGGPPALDGLLDLKAPDFRAWLAARHRRGLAKRSTARALAAVRSFYRFLDRQHGRHNPAAPALRTPRLDQRLPRPLSEQQVTTLLDECELDDGAAAAWVIQRDLALCLLLYGAGLRIGEALALDRSTLGAAPAGLRSLRVTGKGGKERLVPILPEIAAALADYLAACPEPVGRGRAAVRRACAANACKPPWCGAGCSACGGAWACPRMPRPMRCGTASRPISWPAAPICG